MFPYNRKVPAMHRRWLAGRCLLMETLVFPRLRCIGDIVEHPKSRTMSYSRRCYDAFRCFPDIADGFEVHYNTHLRCIGDELLLCSPRDINHPISDNFNKNTFYAMFINTLLEISFLGYKLLGYRFPSI